MLDCTSFENSQNMRGISRNQQNTNRIISLICAMMESNTTTSSRGFINMFKKKYVLVGSGGRAEFFYGALASEYSETSELLAFCDINQTRMDYANKMLEEKYNYK